MSFLIPTQKDRHGETPLPLAWALARAWAEGFLVADPASRGKTLAQLTAQADVYAYNNWQRWAKDAGEFTAAMEPRET